MPLAIPLFVVGVGLLCLLVAYAATVVITPIIESTLRRVPLVGGRLANWSKDATKRAYDSISRWVSAHTRMLAGWLSHWATTIAGLGEGLAALANATYAAIDSLVHDAIPAAIRSALRPVRETAGDALNKAQALETDLADDVKRINTRIDNKAEALEREFNKGIDALERDLRAELERDLARGIDRLRDEITPRINEVEREISSGVAEVEGEIRSLPIAEIAAAAAGVAGLAALVDTIAIESGLDRAECRAKVKGICGTDAGDWAGLLGGLGAVGFGFGLEEIIDAGRELFTALQSEDVVDSLLG